MQATAYLALIHSDLADFDGIGRRYELKKSEMLIGSSASANIQLPPRVAGKEHATLYLEDGLWNIKVSEGEEILVNHILKNLHTFQEDGGLIQIGPVTFKLFLGTGVESSYEQALYQRVIVDALTGAHNRRYLEERLKEELARLSRYKDQTLSLVMFDLDHFREVNNLHGHLAGDFVLKEVVRRIQKRVRKDERLARYGGEEFAIILPGTHHPQALIFAEQIRALIAEKPFVYQDQSLVVTVSMGVASTTKEMDLARFMKKADERLYVAKQAGRNRVQG